MYALLDNDDMFQYLGATAMAIRTLDGKSPTVMLTNMIDPTAPNQETLEKFLGRELKTRYLNPKWVMPEPALLIRWCLISGGGRLLCPNR